MSDFLYDTVQEKTIEEQKEVSPARVVQEEEPPRPVVSDSDDRGDPEEERFDSFKILWTIIFWTSTLTMMIIVSWSLNK